MISISQHEPLPRFVSIKRNREPCPCCQAWASQRFSPFPLSRPTCHHNQLHQPYRQGMHLVHLLRTPPTSAPRHFDPALTVPIVHVSPGGRSPALLGRSIVEGDGRG